MEINIDLTRDDYADYNKYYFLNKRLKKRLYLIIIVAFCISFLVNRGRPFDLLTYFMSLIFAGFVFAILYIGITILSIHLLKKLPADNGCILGKKKFTITDEGLIEESESNVNLQKWKGIKSIETNNNSVFIFVDNIAAYVIPKRFFKDETEQENFIKAIEYKMRNAT
jgi:hypothetical protein